MNTNINPPNKVNITITNGCNLQCPFCGINAWQDPKNRQYQFMDISTAKELAKQLKSFERSKVKFEGKGESLINSNVLEIAEIFREELPNTYITMLTNGTPLGKVYEKYKSKLLLLLNSINVIWIDIYDSAEYQLDLIELLSKDNNFNFPVLDVYKFPKGKSPYGNFGSEYKAIFYMMDLLSLAPDGHSFVSNHHNSAGHSKVRPPTPEPLLKTCELPWTELNCDVNGDIHYCCLSWNNSLVVGNIFDSTLEEIWYSEKYNAIRKMLAERHRGFAECYYCDRKPNRVGLYIKGDEIYKDPDNITGWSKVATSRDIQIVWDMMEESSNKGRVKTSPIMSDYFKNRLEK